MAATNDTHERRIETRDTDSLRPHPKNEDIYGNPELGDDFLDSVERHGIREPLVATESGTIVSGHRRWVAANELDITSVPVRVVEFEDELDEWEAIIDHNRQRKKTPAQIVNEAEVVMEIEKERAKERRDSQLKQGDDTPDKENFPEREKGQARDKAGEKIGVSGRTLEKGLRVKERADEGDEKAQEEWEKMEEGEQSFHGAYEAVTEDDEPDDLDDTYGPEVHECSVCGDDWIDYSGRLARKNGESIDVEKVCVREWPDNVILHIPGGAL